MRFHRQLNLLIKLKTKRLDVQTALLACSDEVGALL